MLRSADDLLGYPIHAKDGDIGRIHDFLFDDERWTIRYIVADTGTWLPGRRVLLAPPALRKVDWKAQRALVELTKEQIEKGPDVESDRPVSRQHQMELYKYYGWAPYWTVTGMGSTYATVAVPPDRKARKKVAKMEEGDPHLRSVREVRKYRIEATDGSIGHVEDFIVEEEGWDIRYMAVDTKNWLPGRTVLIAPQWISKVDWADRKVGVRLSRAEVEGSPKYDPSAPVNREYEVQLYDYYGRPRYWK